MPTIKELDSTLKTRLNNRDVFTKTVTRQSLQAYVSSNAGRLNDLGALCSEISSGNMEKLLRDFLITNMKNKKATPVSVYNKITAKLNRAAVDADKAKVLSSLQFTVKAYADILHEVDKNLATLFKQNDISLFNCRLSHVVILGILVEANIIAKYTSYLITGLIHDFKVAEIGKVAKYRNAFLTDNTDRVAEIVNNTYVKNGAYNFQTIIKNMQRRAQDVDLIDEYNNVLVGEISEKEISKPANGLLKQGIFGIDLFRWIGEQFVSRKRNQMIELQQEKAWLEAHISLLKLDADDVSKSAPEYKRLVKIIGRYEDMVNKQDQELKAYEKYFT